GRTPIFGVDSINRRRLPWRTRAFRNLECCDVDRVACYVGVTFELHWYAEDREPRSGIARARNFSDALLARDQERVARRVDTVAAGDIWIALFIRSWHGQGVDRDPREAQRALAGKAPAVRAANWFRGRAQSLLDHVGCECRIVSQHQRDRARNHRRRL